MKRYRHREDGYEVEVNEQPGSETLERLYFVKRYYQAAGIFAMEEHGIADRRGIFLVEKDFNKLFEPVEEECRCDICGIVVIECLEGLCGNCHNVLTTLTTHGRTMGVKTGRKALEAIVARVRAREEQ